MHPVDHAMSTVVSLELKMSQWKEFMPVHHWMDSTKAVHAYITHRALRHHQEGMDWYCQRQGDIFKYQGGEVSTRKLLQQHLLEDISGPIPEIKDWLETMTKPEWMPKELPTAIEMADKNVIKHGGVAEDWLPIHSWLLDNFGYTEDNRFLCIRNHAFGIFDAEEHFGYVFNNIPTRILAESHIKFIMKKIPNAASWLKYINLQRWMSPDLSTVNSVRNSIQSYQI